nr:immunoglobulin heavy chain junction region [Mus musculus]
CARVYYGNPFAYW